MYGHNYGDGTYVQKVVILDLSAMGRGSPFSKLLDESPVNSRNAFAFVTHSDEDQYKDAYGEPFKEIDPHALLAALETQSKEGYRRAVLAVPIVRAWCDNLDLFPDAVIRYV
jgi:hypothetical protein